MGFYDLFRWMWGWWSSDDTAPVPTVTRYSTWDVPTRSATWDVPSRTAEWDAPSRTSTWSQ